VEAMGADGSGPKAASAISGGRWRSSTGPFQLYLFLPLGLDKRAVSSSKFFFPLHDLSMNPRISTVNVNPNFEDS
jgi:hypothetical protein